MEADLAVFKACADATRLRILLLLCEGQLCVCEIVDVLDMPQGKVSRHLAVLRRAGLVDDERRGTWIHYSLSKPRTSLDRRLRTWLKGEARDSEQAGADLARQRIALSMKRDPADAAASQGHPARAVDNRD